MTKAAVYATPKKKFYSKIVNNGAFGIFLVSTDRIFRVIFFFCLINRRRAIKERETRGQMGKRDVLEPDHATFPNIPVVMVPSDTVPEGFLCKFPRICSSIEPTRRLFIEYLF